MGVIRNILHGMVLLILLFAIGTYVISLTEGLSYFESFYYMFLSITTVGSKYHAETLAGKIITVVMVSLGLGAFLYIATLMAKTIIHTQTRFLLGDIRGGIMKIIKEKNHILVSGYGKIGKYVTEVLKQKRKNYVIIERDENKVKRLLQKGEMVIQGDALDPHTLKKAHLDKAEALVAALGTDADNLYLIISAKELNPKLLLASRAGSEDAVNRLHAVGAHIVVLPEIVGGRELANALIQKGKIQSTTTISKKK